MPTFRTPEPIAVTVEIDGGSARVAASDRDDTVVEVRPSDPSHQADVTAAEQTRVDYASGRLTVRAPRTRGLGLLGKSRSAIHLVIEVPTGSELYGDVTMAALHGTGALGACRWKTAHGDIDVERAGPLDARTGFGAVTVGSVVGDAYVSTGTGEVRLGSVEGFAVVKNANGSTWIGDVGGDLRVKAANGDISVSSAGADVVATSANGDLRLAKVTRGSTSLKTASGEIEIGISDGSAARMDVNTAYGRIRNLLSKVDSPEGSTETLEVHARTGAGDIVIRRA